MLPLVIRHLAALAIVWSLTGCGNARRGYVSTEIEARATCDTALKSNFEDLKIAPTSIPIPVMKRQESPDRWLCEYRIGGDLWTVILDPNSGHSELSRFVAGSHSPER